MALRLDFAAPPAFMTAYRRTLLGRRPGLRAGDTLPPIEAHWRSARLSDANLNAYRDHCGIRGEPGLPMHYPHVLISPLHLRMLTEPEYPLGLLGSVHLRNHAVRYRPIPDDAVLDLGARIVGHRFRPQGIETDVDSWAEIAGETVWRERTCFLVRKKDLPEAPPSPLNDVFPWPGDAAGTLLETFGVPANAGKRYGRISGDYNPIHISRVAARALFGFKRDLVHGMWGLARATAGMDELNTDGPVRVDATFKGPLYMTETVRVQATDCPGGRSLRLFVGKEPRPAMLIAVRAAGVEEKPEDIPD